MVLLFVCLFAFPGLNCLNFRIKERAVEFRHGSLRNHFSSLFAPEDVLYSSAAKSEEKRLFSQVKISVTETVCSFIFKITINCIIPELFRLLICVKEILMSPDLQESSYIRAKLTQPGQKVGTLGRFHFSPRSQLKLNLTNLFQTAL